MPSLQIIRHFIQRRWWVILLVTALVFGAAYVGVQTATERYTASAQLFVAAADTTATTGSTSSTLQSLYAGGLFTQARVQSYVDIIDNTPVLAPAIADAGAKMTPQQLASEVSVDAPLNTVLINIHVTDASPSRAQLLANAVARRFIQFDDSLERVSGSVSPVRISLSQPATLPQSPTSPRRTLDLAMALLVGLALGAGLAVALDVTDKTLRTLDEVSSATSQPILSVVPQNKADLPDVLAMDERSPRAEAFRHMRTNIQFIDVDNPPRMLLVTSPLAGDGKSTVSINLGAVLADAGLRVVLLDADLRAPRLADYLSLESAPGLTDWLRSQEPGDMPLQLVAGRENLFLVSSGPQPPNPSELLASKRMSAAMSDLAERFDVVIIDAPPVLPVTDAAVIARACDGVVVVARAGMTTGGGLRRAVDLLAAVDARILGVIWNGAQASDAPYGYYYGSDVA